MGELEFYRFATEEELVLDVTSLSAERAAKRIVELVRKFADIADTEPQCAC
jgi:hypothetical protein